MVFPIQAILCAVDFSPFCAQVCDFGVALARRAGVRLYLLHAVHFPQDRIHPTPAVEHGGDLAQFIADANRRLHGLMEQAAVDWEPVVRCGDPVEQTLAVVDALPPCLVISASHGVSGVRRLFIGTVVERLSRTLDCPMLVMKSSPDHAGGRAGGFRSVVVSCDAHGHWKRMIRLLDLLQPDPTGPIHLVHALEGPMPSAMDQPTVSYAEAQQDLQHRLAHQVQQQARSWFADNKPLSAVVAPGEPQDVVLRVARERRADLITVGVRPSGRMGRLISGSTTEALLRHGDCCILTVPEPKALQASPGEVS